MFIPRFDRTNKKMPDKTRPVSDTVYRAREVARLVKEGKTQREIAEELGIPRGSVASIIKENYIKRP